MRISDWSSDVCSSDLLAAERLQRRFGDKVEGDTATFKRLTDTVIRQVHDMRRMVDEFSSFARMPKPTFGVEDVRDILKQAVFLFEVAKPDIRFHVRTPDRSEEHTSELQSLMRIPYAV